MTPFSASPSPAAPRLPGHHLELGRLRLDCGVTFGPFNMAYRTYGALDAQKTNAILICHALTGDQYVADETHPVTGRPGWWRTLVGPGRPVDTERYFVICSNVLGGCLGTTGPKDVNPETGEPWALDFPVVTIADMVRAQVMLLDRLGIERLFAAIGGSMGGMQVLEWAARYPHRVRAAIPIATSYRHSAQNIAFYEIGRQAVMADPDWCGGRYQIAGKTPARGLAVARMTAHVTYMSESALHRKFGRKLQTGDHVSYSFDQDFQIESYLRHQGRSFVERFDANSYLYITRAMDYFELDDRRTGSMVEIFRDTPVRFCLISFSSDWHFPTAESRAIAHALNAAGAAVSCVEIETDKGHDAFLLDEPEFLTVVRGFLEGTGHARMRGSR